MGEMQYHRAVIAKLAGDAGMDQAQHEVGILQPMRFIAIVEAVNRDDVRSECPQIAGLRLAPVVGATVAPGAIWQAQEFGRPGAVVAQTVPKPSPSAPARRYSLGHNMLRQARAQIASLAGHELAMCGQFAVLGDEIVEHEAIAIEEDDIVANARPNRPIANARQAKAAIGVAHMLNRHRAASLGGRDNFCGAAVRPVIGHDDFEAVIGLSLK